MKSVQIFCVKPGDTFYIQVMGPNPSPADPTGTIGGSEHKFNVAGLDVVHIESHKTIFVPDPTNPHLERVKL